MPPNPLYTTKNLERPAYHLRYAWTGWPSTGRFPPTPTDGFFSELSGA